MMIELFEAVQKAQDIGITWIVIGTLGWVTWKNHIANVKRLEELERMHAESDNKVHMYIEKLIAAETDMKHTVEKLNKCLEKLENCRDANNSNFT